MREHLTMAHAIQISDEKLLNIMDKKCLTAKKWLLVCCGGTPPVHDEKAKHHAAAKSRNHHSMWQKECGEKTEAAPVAAGRQ
jgi:hypothetical protein